jgi:membrane-bound inhibitor of C-type lysozyme
MLPSPANTALIFGKDANGNSVPIGVTAGVQASGTLTSDNTVVTTGDTVTIDGKVYTFRTALTAGGVDGEVLIVAADADNTLLNLINAINASGAKVNGVDYVSKILTGHPTVTAATSVTAHAFLVTARDVGTQGNSIATTETSTHLSWGAVTLTGGTNASLSIGALAAGEAHLGSIGGNTAFVTSTPVMSVAGAYATGDYIGTTTTPQAFANAVRTTAGTGIIKSIAITDKNTTAAVALELWVFSATFVAPTDNAAWAITDAENLLCMGVIPIATTKWYASSNNKAFSDDTINLVIKPAATSLFYALVARGTTPSWTSGDLQITLGILND